MVQLTPADRVRLLTLKNKKIIKGWQDAGGPNYGISADPLPFVIFPINEGAASVYYNNDELRVAMSAMEQFGPLDRPGVVGSDCDTCGRYHA
jgi:hypothetical protein